MIRDRPVVGLRDASLLEKLQLNETLTLEKAVAKAGEAEAVRQQQSVVRGEEPKKPETPVGAVHRGTPNKRRAPHVPRQRGGATARGRPRAGKKSLLSMRQHACPRLPMMPCKGCHLS